MVSCGAMNAFLLALALAAVPATPPSAVPTGWSASGSGTAKGSDGADLARASSITLSSPAGGGQTTVLSAPLKLSVGKLYRLSAELQARGVRADPTARYPTALGACVAMKSFPFTNCSPPVAGDASRRVEVLFFATTASDRVALHLGRNGKSTGSVTFETAEKKAEFFFGALSEGERKITIRLGSGGTKRARTCFRAGSE